MRRRQSCRAVLQLGTREPACIFELTADLDHGVRIAACLESDHERCGKWPGLGGMVANVAHGNGGLLGHLAHHRILEALAGFNKSCDGRIAPGRPGSLPAKQGARAVAHEDDDRWIEARKYLLRTIGRRAPERVTGALRMQPRPADAAEALPRTPNRKSPCIGEQSRLLRR